MKYLKQVYRETKMFKQIIYILTFFAILLSFLLLGFYFKDKIWSFLFILFFFYLLNHILRLLTKMKFCAKCAALLMAIIFMAVYSFHMEIIFLLLGSLLTIFSYYTDDYLMKKNINFTAQDFVILLFYLFIASMVVMFYG